MTATLTPIVHGPTRSARLGRLMAIDLTAPQNNLVVERGSQLPRGSVVVTSAARKLMEHSKAGDKLDHIVVLGSSVDPTEHPDLGEVTENLRALRDKWYSRAKLCILTGSLDLASAPLRLTLSHYNKLFFQYEWGTAKTFATLTGEKGTALRELTRHLVGFDHLIVEAKFFRGDVNNSTDSEVKNWIKKLQDVRPEEVHILRGPRKVEGKKLRAVTPTRQKQIADAVSESGLAVAIHEDETLLVD